MNLALDILLLEELTEPLESFQERVVQSYKNPLSSKREDIYESMGFVTPLREKVLLEIGLVDDTQSRIKITSSKIYVWKNKEEDPIIEKELKEYKFVVDLIEDLSIHSDVFTFRTLDDYEPYLKCINLMPFDTDQNYREFSSNNSEINLLPEKYVDELIDFNNVLTNEVPVQEESNSFTLRSSTR